MAKKKSVQPPLVTYFAVAFISLTLVIVSILVYRTALKNRMADAHEPSSVIGTVVLNKLYTGSNDELVASLKLSAVSNSGLVTEMKIWTGSTEPADWITYQKTTIVELKGSNQIHVRYRDEFGNESGVYSDYTTPPTSSGQ